MDEAGQPADAASRDGGTGGESRADQPRPGNGWARTDAWSDAASTEPGPDATRSPWQQPDGLSVTGAWADQSARYTGLLPPLAAPAPTPNTRHTTNGVSYPDRQHERHRGPQATDSGPQTARFPASAPPYPYESDREDATGRAAIPRPRSAPPADGRPDLPGSAGPRSADSADPPEPKAQGGSDLSAPAPQTRADAGWRRLGDSDQSNVLPLPTRSRWRPAGDMPGVGDTPGPVGDTPGPAGITPAADADPERSDGPGEADAPDPDQHESSRYGPGGPTAAHRGRSGPAADEPPQPARRPASTPDPTSHWAPDNPRPPAAGGRGGDSGAGDTARRGDPGDETAWARPTTYGHRHPRTAGDDRSPGWPRRTPGPDDVAAPYRPSIGTTGPAVRTDRAGAGDPTAATRTSPGGPPADPAAGGTGATDGATTYPVDPRSAATGPGALPQRVPAEPDVPSVPDVPTVPEPSVVEPATETPELTRIASHLRRADPETPGDERPDGFDVNAILAAVRGVAGVRDASLRTTPAGAHSLRLDVADGADPAEVSRHVVRLLQERMGLAAAPQNPFGGAADDRAAGPAESYGPDRFASRSDGPRPTRTPGTAPLQRRQRGPHPPTSGGDGGASTASAYSRPAGSTLGGDGGPVGGDGGPVGAAGLYSGGPVGTSAAAPSRSLGPAERPGPRTVIDHVQVSTFGLEATVEVRLTAGRYHATGLATGPAVDGYVLRLCASAAASAVDKLLHASERAGDRGRCFVEHAAVVPLGGCEVAVVVVLMACDGWVEQLAGSALVAGDPRQAVVRATLAAVNRRLEALLS